jgi:hypothetical protein
VFDASTWRRDLMLGECAISVADVLAYPHSRGARQMHRVWLALSEPRFAEDDQDVRLAGFLQVTITVLFGREQRLAEPPRCSELKTFLAPARVWPGRSELPREERQLLRSGAEEAGASASAVHVPQPFRVIVKIFRAEDFRAHDSKSSAPFVRLMMNGEDPVQTQVDGSMQWNEQLSLPLPQFGVAVAGSGKRAAADLRHCAAWRTVVDNLVVQLHDGGGVAADARRADGSDAQTLIASHRMHMSKLSVEPAEGWPLYQAGGVDRRRGRMYPAPFWINFYGSATGNAQTLLGVRMNEADVGVVPTDYCGRLFVQMYVQNPWNEVPPQLPALNAVVEAEQPELYTSASEMYTLRFDLFRGTGFPEKSKAYDLYVEVKIGSQTFRPKACSDDKTVTRSADGLSMQCAWNEPFENTQLHLHCSDAELPDVFVNVYERKTRGVGSNGRASSANRLGCLKLSVKNNAWPFNRRDPIWMQLQPDRLSEAWNTQQVKEGGRKRTGWLQFRLQFGPRAMEHIHVVQVQRTLGDPLAAGQQRTERLGDIADRYNTSAQQICAQNHIVDSRTRQPNSADTEGELRERRLPAGTKLSVPRELAVRALVPAVTHAYELRAFVYQARHLPFREHFSDPFVEISIASKTARTRTVKNSCYPSWYQVVTIPDVELRLDPKTSKKHLARDAGEYSRYAEFITVKVRDNDPHAGDKTVGRFEVRLAECDIITAHTVREWRDTENAKEEVKTNLTLDALRDHLAMRGNIEDIERRNLPVATSSDWWSVVPERDVHGDPLPIRDEAGDLLMPDAIKTVAHGELLIWFQLVQKDPVVVNHWDRDWLKALPEDWESDAPAFTQLHAVRKAHTKDLIVSLPALVSLPNRGNITPTGESCIIEFQALGVRDLMPTASRDVVKPYIEIDPGDGMDPSKKMCSRKCSRPNGANGTHLECQRVQLRLPEDPLFSPTFQVRVYDFRDNGARTCLVGTCFLPVVEFLPNSWQWGRTSLDSRKRAEMLREWRMGNPLHRLEHAHRLIRNSKPLAKEAMQAELYATDAAIKFRFVEIDGNRIDPRVIESKQSIQLKHFERSMKHAQLQYLTYVEQKRMEEEQSEEAVMGTHDFLEHKARKAKKRILGAHFNLDMVEGSDVGKLADDLLQHPQDPGSIVFHEEGLQFNKVDKGDLQPKPPRLGGSEAMPRAKGMAPPKDVQGMVRESRLSLFDEADRVVTGYRSRKPRDLYGAAAQFDPETGYPINPQTGNAYDPVLKMDIDPVTKLYLNPDTNLPIDPNTGFCFDRHTGMMYDPITRKAVVFNHRDQLARLPHSRELDVHTPVHALPNRRIGKPYEEVPSFRPPFKTFKLYRGIVGRPYGDKLAVGDVKLNVRVLSSQRRHEDPVLTNLRAITLGSENLYVVRVYVLHGFDIMGIVDPFLRDAAKFKDGIVRQPRMMPFDGDTCNLYLRIRVGGQVRYDTQGDSNLIRVNWCTSNPDFYACLQFAEPISLPGVSKLHVEVWDHQLTRKDPSSPDSPELTKEDVEAGFPRVGPSSTKPLHKCWTQNDRLVGTTVIDLEDRLFSADWRNLLHKPVERRKLWSPRSSSSQGKLEMFVDMLPFDKAQYTPPCPVETMVPKPIPFELRIVLWQVTELDFRGEYFKKINHPRAQHAHIPIAHRHHPNIKNFYMRATFKDCDRQRQPHYLWKPTMRSDTHFNVSAASDASSTRKDGNNLAKVLIHWRFCWKVNLPSNNPRLKLELCDRDTGEVWASCFLNMSDLFMHARRTQRAVSYEPPIVDSPDPRVHVSGAGRAKNNPELEADDSVARPFVAFLKHPNHHKVQGKLHLSVEVSATLRPPPPPTSLLTCLWHSCVCFCAGTA